MLKFTGHPFLDVGVAAITAYAQKRRPEDVTQEDLGKVAAYIEQNYVIPPLSSTLTMSLPNSGFTQPAFDITKKRAYARVVSQGFMENALNNSEQCIFTGDPALQIPLALKDDIPSGRVFRQHVPLLSGEGTINFFPEGAAGLPISGEALLSFQFMTMGCAKCGGRLLAVHSENIDMTVQFAESFLQNNLKAILKAQEFHQDKMEGSLHSPKTLLIDTLCEIERNRRETNNEQNTAFSITAYYFTNSGQGPELAIYHLPMNIMSFVLHLQTVTYKAAWEVIVQRSWQLEKNSKNQPANIGANHKTKTNYLYEDLFQLENPAQWGRFIRTYFLRIPMRYKNQTDPRRDYNLQEELSLVSWQLVELFLRKVVFMDTTRIAQISALGDQLATYVRKQGGKRWFREFFTVNRPDFLRTQLIKANLDNIRSGQTSLFDMNGYIEVFEEGVDIARPDWRLARDLVLMRMIDQLQDWLPQNRDAIPDTSSENFSETETAEQ